MITRGIIRGVKNASFVSIVNNSTNELSTSWQRRKTDKIVTSSLSSLQSVNGRKTQLSNVKYLVYLPLIDGGDNTTLHEAVYCQLPHETTYFSTNDVVYVAMVDMDMSDLVILGMADRDGLQSVQTGKIDSQFRFSQETQSTFGMQNIDYLECNSSNSLFVVPQTLQLKVGSSSSEKLDLTTLTGMESGKNLGTVVWGPLQGGTGIALSENASDEERITAGRKFAQQLGMVGIEILNQTAFDKRSTEKGDNGLKENTLYFIYTDSADT